MFTKSRYQFAAAHLPCKGESGLSLVECCVVTVLSGLLVMLAWQWLASVIIEQRYVDNVLATLARVRESRLLLARAFEETKPIDCATVHALWPRREQSRVITGVARYAIVELNPNFAEPGFVIHELLWPWQALNDIDVASVPSAAAMQTILPETKSLRHEPDASAVQHYLAFDCQHFQVLSQQDAVRVGESDSVNSRLPSLSNYTYLAAVKSTAYFIRPTTRSDEQGVRINALYRHELYNKERYRPAALLDFIEDMHITQLSTTGAAIYAIDVLIRSQAPIPYGQRERTFFGRRHVYPLTYWLSRWRILVAH